MLWGQLIMLFNVNSDCDGTFTFLGEIWLEFESFKGKTLGYEKISGFNNILIRDIVIYMIRMYTTSQCSKAL